MFLASFLIASIIDYIHFSHGIGSTNIGEAHKADAMDFISKPFDKVDVKTRIHNMLEIRICQTKSSVTLRYWSRPCLSVRHSSLKANRGFAS